MTAPSLHALLIGIDYYQPDPVPGAYSAPASLKGCVRDVCAVEYFLTTRLGVLPDRLRKLTSTAPADGKGAPLELPADRPTYANMVSAFRNLVKSAARGDMVYIHYSGHGARAATRWPELKGKDPWDEGLAPYDIADPSAQYLRDLELGHLVRELVGAGFFVTLTLDCCHSGGTARGPHANRVGVRSAGADLRPRIAPSAVATDDELAAGSRRTTAAARSLAVGAGWAPPSGDYILLAACRAHEYAYEFPFDGTSNSGALTYWLLDAARGARAGLSYRDVYDRVLARVHTQFDRQTPLLLGPGHRVFLGTDLIPVLPPAVTVLAVEAETAWVRLRTGQALGVRKGTRFALYPQGTEPTVETPKVVVEVEDAGATESAARVLTGENLKGVQVGDCAVQLGSATLRRKVRVDAAGPNADAFGPALASSGWLEEAPPGEAAEFHVNTTAGAQSYVVADAADLSLPHAPHVPVDGGNAVRQIVGILEHVARYRAVQEIENHNADSPLLDGLSVELLGRQRQCDPSDLPAFEPFLTGAVPELSVGEWVLVCIRNTSQRVLNISVLELSPGWKVSRIFPSGGDLSYESLEPGGEKLLKLRASLPGGLGDGTDVIKVFATVGPADFQALTLPALELAGPKRVTRSAADRGLSRGQTEATELDRLFDALTATHPLSRDLVLPHTPGAEWTVASVVFRVVNPFGSQDSARHSTTHPTTSDGADGLDGSLPPQIQVANPPVPCPPRVRVVFMAAQPDQLTKTRTDKECRLIQAAWREADNETRQPFEIAPPRLAAQPTDLPDELRSSSSVPAIIHYGGHGTGRNGLAFEDKEGGMWRVAAGELAEIFSSSRGQVWCVVLNACYSEEQARAIAAHVPYVIGIRGEVVDSLAVDFAQEFYKELFSGKNIIASYKQACVFIPESQRPVLMIGDAMGFAAPPPPPPPPPPFPWVRVTGGGLVVVAAVAFGLIQLGYAQETEKRRKAFEKQRDEALEQSGKFETALKAVRVKPVRFDQLVETFRALDHKGRTDGEIQPSDVVLVRGYVELDVMNEEIPRLKLSSSPKGGKPFVLVYFSEAERTKEGGKLTGTYVGCVGRVDTGPGGANDEWCLRAAQFMLSDAKLP